jgi:hypothetical protein
LSRLRFSFAIALLGVAAVLVACGGGDRSSESPQAILDDATLEGIDSGDLDLTFDVQATGKEGGNVDFSLAGPFEGEATGGVPKLDVDAVAKGNFDGEPIDFDGGVVLLPNVAYVNYEGVEYEVDPSTYAFLESILQPESLEGEEGEEGGSDAAACQKAVGKVRVGEFLENGRNEGIADVGGTETVKVSGDLDVPAALDAVLEVVESPACEAQVAAAGPLPSKSEIEEAKKELRGGVKTAHVEVYVGDDDIVRRIVAQVRVEPKEGREGPERADIDFDLTLTGVNEEQEIVEPQNAKPLGVLFAKLGVNPLELLGLIQGEGAEGLGNLLQGQEGGQGLGNLLEGLGGIGGKSGSGSGK